MILIWSNVNDVDNIDEKDNYNIIIIIVEIFQ